MKINYMTQEGYDKLEAELLDLKTRGRQECAAAIATAREKGDLSENAEYDAAKDAQGMLEMKISEMDKAFASARVIDSSQLDSSRVVVLSKVKMKNVANGKELTYQLVSQAEADLKLKKISVDSPIGAGLLGKKIGEIAEIQTPRAIMKFEILDISF